MPVRTSEDLVIKVLGDDYGLRADRSLPDMNTYIVTASNIVDQLVIDAAAAGFILSSSTLELIERWLSAHYYTKSDPAYTSRSTEGSSGSFVRSSTDPEPYVGPALDLDSSGCLNAILKRQRAGGVWLGKPAPDQLTYRQRN